MENVKDKAMQFSLLSLLFFGLLYLFLWHPFGSKSDPLFSIKSDQVTEPSNTSNATSYSDGLEVALMESSMENKTVIIAIVNKAYVEGEKPMLDLFLDSFWLGEDTRGLVDHLLLVTVDQTAFERCKFLKLHCYKLETDGVDFDGEKLYMSNDFVKMMWSRTLFLGEVLKRGFNFIFTETDVMWLRNPLPRLSLNESIDLQMSTDEFNGNEWSETAANVINTGFYMIRSNKKTISLLNEWYARKDNSTGLKEQDVFNNMMKEGALSELGLKVRFLDTRYFSGFCQDSREMRSVTTVHANCCRTISAKVADLTAVLRTWRRFKSSPANDTLAFKRLKHVECVASWRSFNFTSG